ncbi:MAG: AAA family ATPase, partial [Bacteroidales bacterium]|nr:AAA family ATPase [Bacteroidales bacterium]
MAAIRKMPIGIQDFEKLRTGGNLYVDKTMYIETLLSIDAPYFLGRPRRFGKSLFLSTLKYYFQGRKDLFEGLYISTVEKEWAEYPVIYITFNKAEYQDADALKVVLDATLNEYEKQWKIVDKCSMLSVRFDQLIKTAYQKSGRKVVILIDEYDKPLLSSMQDEALNDKIRSELKGFYSVLKAADESLKFVFLTGVTKFSKVSIFSDLNRLNDISMLNNYSGICGISERELLRDFQPEIQALAEKQQLD